MTKKDLYAGIEQILELEAGTLKDEDVLDELGSWDSLAVISFIALVDETLKVSLAPEEIKQALRVKELVSLVEMHLENNQDT